MDHKTDDQRPGDQKTNGTNPSLPILGDFVRHGLYWKLRVPLLGIDHQTDGERPGFRDLEVLIEKDIRQILKGSNEERIKVEVSRIDNQEMAVRIEPQRLVPALMIKGQALSMDKSLRQVSKELGLKSPDLLYKYVHGKSVPGIMQLIQILNVINPNLELAFGWVRNSDQS